MNIFAHTADITEHNNKKCQQYGFDNVFEKPMKKEILKFIKSIVKSWLMITLQKCNILKFSNLLKKCNLLKMCNLLKI